jgi:CRP/FNR family transcriptional regulator, cyclic AMP receptor protein
MISMHLSAPWASRRRDNAAQREQNPHHGHYNGLIAVLCGRLRRTNEQVEDAMFVSLAVRLAKALLSFAHIDAANIRPVEVPITQRELGEMIGFSRENTNKQLRAWEKRQWVKLARGRIKIVDPGALLRLSEDGAGDVSFQ